jgi:biotin transport system substrate-specific component
VLLVGASLGTVRGGAASLLYVAIGIAGAPVFADASHGWAVFTGASGGYLLGMPLAAALTGYLAEHGWDKKFSSSVSAMLTGNVLIYLCGLPWLAVVLNTNLEKTLEYGLYPFVPGDLFKLYIAAAALPGAWKLVQKFR